MGKQSDKKATNAPDKFFVFGIDSTGKSRGARFPEFNDRALKFALDIGMIGIHPASPEFTERAMKLPAGRLYASGKAFIPNIRRDAVKELNAILSSAGETSQQHRLSPPTERTEDSSGVPQVRTLSAIASGLPRSWDSIEVGQVVLAEEDGVNEGYWACVVIKREQDILTLRLRDFPKQRQKYVRHVAQVALIYPGPTPE
jgi:hypothetical protein